MQVQILLTLVMLKFNIDLLLQLESQEIEVNHF